MIRRATPADLAEIVSLGAEFLEASPSRWIPLNEADFAETASRLIDGAGAIFLSDDGFIGGITVPCYFNFAHSFAAELFWFARKEGQELREAFEAWGRERGATAATASGLADGREKAIRRVFRSAGYETMEIGFMKRFI